MKTILLLGGYGFIGTNILKYIDKFFLDQYQVIVFDKLPSHFAQLHFQCVCNSYVGDFSDSVLLDSVFEAHQIDLVIHSISTTIPSQSFNACYDVETNLVPTLNLCSSMLKHKVSDIIYISSGGAIYGNNCGSKRHVETEDVFPISSYGVVKLAIEKYLMQFSMIYGFRPLILRLSNPYGPFHYSMKQGVCNVAIAKGLHHEALSIWGDGSSMKDYIYIDDVVDIIFKLLQLGVHSQVLNIGSGCVVSVNEILEWVKSYIPDLKYLYTNPSKFDVTHFELDTTKLTGLIGEYNYTSLEEGIKRTYNWAKNNIQ